MSSRRQHIPPAIQSDVNLEDMADGIFGGKSTNIMKAKDIDIFTIWPDRAQPRRAVPRVVAGDWSGYPKTAATVLQRWVDIAHEESAINLDVVRDLIEGDTEFTFEQAECPLTTKLVDLVNLAANIWHHGLINAATITATKQTQYKIVTGERRWLAYHLLYAMYGEAWQKIPARIVDADIWQQAGENGAREPLNAIGQARQLALLIMAAMTEQGATFRTYDDMIKPGECDRSFYAQVADGNANKIPSGYGERIRAAMGIKSHAQTSQIRRLLNMPDGIWTLADDQNWSEGRCRDYIQELEGSRGTRTTLTTVKVPSSESDDETFGLISTDEPIEDYEYEVVETTPSNARPFDKAIFKDMSEAQIVACMSDSAWLAQFHNPDRVWHLCDEELTERQRGAVRQPKGSTPHVVTDLSKARDPQTPYVDLLAIAQHYLRHVETEGAPNEFWTGVQRALYRVHNINVDDMELEQPDAPAHSIPPVVSPQTAPTPSQAATDAALFDEATRAILLAYADAGRNYGFDTSEVILLAHMTHAQAAEYAAIDWLALYNRVTDGTLNAISAELANRLFEAYETVRRR